MATADDGWEDAPETAAPPAPAPAPAWESPRPKRAPSIYAPREEWAAYRESGPPVPPPSMAGKPLVAPGQTPLTAAKTTGKALAGVLLEPLATLATGGVSGVLGGVGGAARTAYGLMKGEEFDTAASAGADVVRGTQQALTYQPQTEMGQFTMAALGAPFEAASKGLGAAGEAAGAPVGPRTSAALGTLGAAVPEAAGALLGARGLAAGLKKAPGPVPLTQTQAAIADAQQAGFKSLPSEAKPGLTRSVAEAAAYRPQLIKDLVRENEITATNLIKNDLRLAPTDALDTRTLGRIRDAAGRVYEGIKNINERIDIARTDPNFRTAVVDLDSQFRSMKNVLPELYHQPGLERLRAGLGRLNEITPAEIIDITKNLRDTASSTFKNPGASDSALTAARAMRGGADLLEGLLERHLQTTGRSQLYNDFTAARQQIAKTYDVEAMSDLVKGVVDPQIARRMLEKGVPLSGGMEQVARAAAAMPNVVRSAEGMGIRAEGGTRVLTSAPARALVMSEGYQRGLTPQGKPMRTPIPMSDVAAGAAALQPQRPPFAMSEEEQ